MFLSVICFIQLFFKAFSYEKINLAYSWILVSHSEFKIIGVGVEYSELWHSVLDKHSALFHS